MKSRTNACAYPDIKSNYEEVKEAAAKLGTDIKIYPVKTLDEAIEILKKSITNESFFSYL